MDNKSETKKNKSAIPPLNLPQLQKFQKENKLSPRRHGRCYFDSAEWVMCGKGQIVPLHPNYSPRRRGSLPSC